MTRTRLWTHDSPQSTPMWKFLQHVNSKYKLALEDYPSLYRWSVENIAEFWGEVWHFTGIKSSKPFDQVGVLFFPAFGIYLQVYMGSYNAVQNMASGCRNSSPFGPFLYTCDTHYSLTLCMVFHGWLYATDAMFILDTFICIHQPSTHQVMNITYTQACL